MTSTTTEIVDPPQTREHDNAHPHFRAPAQSGAGSATLTSAVRRHPFLVLLPAVLLLVAGIYVGSRKHPTYSATATINVGKSDINTQATPGYVQASETLASTYSRLVASQHISIPASQALHESPATVSAHLSSVPIPSQPTFTITATGPSPGAAVRLVNAAVSSLQAFVNQSATQQGGTDQLLSRYQAAQALADRLELRSSTLQAQLSSHLPGVTAAKVTAAKLAGQVASLKAQALSNSYLSLSTNGSAPALDVLVDPTSASTNNRRSNIEKYGVVGAVAGLAIGIALAGFVGMIGAHRSRRRALAAT